MPPRRTRELGGQQHVVGHDPDDAPYDLHDDILARLEANRSETERKHRDRQLQAWRDAVPAEEDVA